MGMKTVAIPARLSIEVKATDYGSSTTYSSGTSSFQIPVGRTPITDAFENYIAVYEWNISDMSESVIPAGSPVISAEIEFYSNNPEKMRNLQIVGLVTPDQPSTDTAENLWNRSQSDSLVYVKEPISSTQKEVHLVTLSESGENQVQQSVNERRWFAVAIRKDKSDNFSATVDVGGVDLSSSGWKDGSGLPVSPPLLIITYETLREDAPIVEMRYTTQDPLTSQLTPSNSLGSYLSVSKVFSDAELADFISSTQNFIPIDGNLPSRSSGLVSVGPEVMEYKGLDTDRNRLINVTRSKVPIMGFPAGFDEFGNPETVHYLHPTNKEDSILGTVDLHRLFGQDSPTGLVQYRCVAIYHTGAGSETPMSIDGVEISLIQNKSAVQLDVGIEVPRHDAHLGNHDGSGSEGQIFTDSNFSEFDSGYFAGSLVFFPNKSKHAIIDTFDEGEFILDSSVGTISENEPFRILPAPAQSVSNESVNPNNNNNRFNGFVGEGGSSSVELVEHGNVMQQFDLFYVWIKRTLTSNTDKLDNTGAVLMLEFTTTRETT